MAVHRASLPFVLLLHGDRGSVVLFVLCRAKSQGVTSFSALDTAGGTN